MESNEKINYCRYVVPREDENSVNSNVIVKQTTVLCAKFSKLECNTNLNLPPSNWLTNDGNSYGLRSFLSPSKGFCSFRMAHMFPDCICEIDVVSSAENIKNLLKLPYSPKSTISMMVHRIENTLLIDDFDLYKFLLQQADDDWKWLRSFIIENLSPKDRSLLLKSYCSKENFEQKKLLSKFLYHSLLTNDLSNDIPTVDINTDEHSTIVQELRSGPLLPEPSVDENVPENGDHIFNRNVVWTFEDIRMLIGTDMPIFGGQQNQPCISLKLRDMSKPINILTGIDYWLDNLMCNVPEVVMCYHLDGLVQKYELIKTEDLPYLENSNFSPKVIRNVAQNILSFLKRNATKAGHTYWLFKGSNDEFVKLYDLTSLCTNTDESEPGTDTTETTKLENPFTVPVAMLLYKVAKNMMNMTENMSAKQAGSIKALLDNCIQLLPKEKYPQIVTSSHYILSDLLLPADIDPTSPIFYPNDHDSQTTTGYHDNANLNESDSTSDQTVESNSDEIALKTVIESNLEKNWKHNSSPPPITDDVKERCFMALEHIAEGLSCLQFFSQTEEKLTKEKEELDKENEKRKILLEELNPKMAEPYVPIPLPYERLKPEAQQINTNKAIPMGWKAEESADVPVISQSASNRKSKKKKRKNKKPGNADGRNEDGRALLLKGKSGVIQSWNVHLKLLLLEKACLTYATLAEQFYHDANFGKTLRFILMAINCQKIVAKHMNTISFQTVCLMGRAGDCFFQIATSLENMEVNRKEFYSYSKTDLAISGELEKEDKVVDVFDLVEDVEDLMYSSLNCYASALDMLEPNDEKRRELVRRIGSVRNELGVKCMYWAQDAFVKSKEEQPDDASPEENVVPLYQTLTSRSYSHLVCGIEAFEEIKDEANLAILFCNMGRFYRFRANIHLPGDVDTMEIKKQIYENAFHHYNRALGILGSKKDNPELWDILTWELSTSTFTWAQLMMDNTDDFDDGNCSKLIDLWQKALKACVDKSSAARQPLYQYRKALIHARLGTLIFTLYESNRAAMKKFHSQLCHFHDDKAIALLKELCSSVEDGTECLAIHLRQLQLHSLCADDFSKISTRIECLRLSLSYAFSAKFIFELFADEAENLTDVTVERMECFEKSLQTVLKKTVKLSMKLVVPSGVTNYFKNVYALTLRKQEKLNGLEMAKHLVVLLEKIASVSEQSP